MSRSLDIAKILRATEIDNTTNSPLVTNTNQLGGGMDSSAVQSIPMQYYETLDSLPVTNLSIGLQAFVEENRKHYVSNGSGWYNTGYSIGASPYWDSDPLSSYTIVDSQTPLIVIAKPQDSDTANFVNQSFGSDSAQYMATITNDSSVFTFTPKTKAEIATAVAAGNLTDSDGDFVYTFKWSDGINFVAKAATITYNTAPTGMSPSSMNDYADATIPISYQTIHMKFNGNGTALTWWYQYQNMEWWDLSSPYDLSTASYNNSKSSSPNNLFPAPYDNFLSFDYNGDGSKMISLSYGTGGTEPLFRLAEWDLSTNYDPNSRGSSPSTIKSVTSTAWSALGYGSYSNYYYIDWQGLGKYVTIGRGNSASFVLFENTNFSNQPYDFSSVDFTNVVSVQNNLSSTTRNVWISDDGSEMWYCKSGGKIRKATVTTPWDFSTVSYVADSEKVLGSTGTSPTSAGSIDELIVVPSVRKVFIASATGQDANGNYYNNNVYGNGWYSNIQEFRL